MKFTINTEVFAQAVKPVADIALKNTIKVKVDEISKDYRDAKKISIAATPEELIINACGGSAGIVIRLKKCDGYIFEESGGITVRAKELQSALKTFPLSDNLIITIEDCYVKITLESNQQIYISVPSNTQHINLPQLPDKYKQVTVVDSECFLKGLQKIKFAPADQEKMYSYKCILFESWKNKIRFSAGTGGRFAVIDYNGNKESISTNKTRLLFSAFNVSNIIRIFKKTSCSTIKIMSCERDNKKCIHKQIVLEADNIVVYISGLDDFRSYPDISKVFNFHYSYQISTSIEAWRYVTEAIAASRHFYKDNIHNTRAIADLVHGHFDITTNTEMKMNRRVEFELGTYVIDPTNDKNHKPWFCCNSDYLREMVMLAGKSDIVDINFDDQTKLDEIPDDKPQKIRPVMIKYPEKMNKDGVRENSYMFFTVSSKWQE